MSGNRSLLESSSWDDIKEAVKKQERVAREEEERIKEAQRLLEETGAVIPELLGLPKKDEEFVNADVNEFDTNEDGFAGEDGLMSDPLETLRQCKVSLDKQELEEAEKENGKKAEKEKGKKRQRGRRSND